MVEDSSRKSYTDRRALQKAMNKQARCKYVIDMVTFWELQKNMCS